VNRSEEKRLLEPMIKAANAAAAAMPPLKKADVFDGIATALTHADPTLAKEARQCARLLRDAETMQLHFNDLFRDHE